MKDRIRKYIKRKFELFDISDLQIGGLCGCCGKWVEDKITDKEWNVTLCEDCIK